jgi:hypothetical protein
VSTSERSLLDHLLAGLIDENVLLWVTATDWAMPIF